MSWLDSRRSFTAICLATQCRPQSGRPSSGSIEQSHTMFCWLRWRKSKSRQAKWKKKPNRKKKSHYNNSSHRANRCRNARQCSLSDKRNDAKGKANGIKMYSYRKPLIKLLNLQITLFQFFFLLWYSRLICLLLHWGHFCGQFTARIGLSSCTICVCSTHIARCFAFNAIWI